MAAKTVVVLGGGVGGVVAANRLRSLLDREHRVVVVDRTIWHSYPPSFTWVMMGWRRPEQVSRDIRCLERKGIEVEVGEVTAIDLSDRQVLLDDGRSIGWDFMVVALGSDYATEGIPGLELASTYYTLDGAEALREEVAKFKGGRIVIMVASVPYKCPAAPYEGALLLDYTFRRQRIRDEVEIQLVTPEPQPMPVAGSAVGARAEAILAERGIDFRPRSQVKAVDRGGQILQFGDGSQMPFDLLIAVPGHRPPKVVAEAGLAMGEEWVSVDRETLATAVEGVYAIGDVTHVPLVNGMQLPKAGVFAYGEAETVARNISSKIEGSAGPEWAYGGDGACFLEIGFGKAAQVGGRFFARGGPQVAMRGPSRFRHWQKQGMERWWLWRWF